MKLSLLIIFLSLFILLNVNEPVSCRRARNYKNGDNVLDQVADTGQCILNCVQNVGKGGKGGNRGNGGKGNNGKSSRRMSYYEADGGGGVQQVNTGTIIQTIYNIGQCVINVSNG